MRSQVIPLHALMVDGRPVFAAYQKSEGQWREIYRRRLRELPDEMDHWKKREQAMLQAEQFHYLECVLAVWPGWGNGLKGWMSNKRSPFANISPWVAAQDMAELRDATMKEF